MMLWLIKANLWQMRHVNAVRSVVFQQLLLRQHDKLIRMANERHCVQTSRAQQPPDNPHSEKPENKQTDQCRQRVSKHQHQLQQPTLTQTPTQTHGGGLGQCQTQTIERQKLKILHSQQERNNHMKPEITMSMSSTSPLDNNTAATMSSYNIDWVFSRLRNPSKFWYIASQIAITVVSILSKFVMRVMCRTHVYNRERLVNALEKRPKGIPLVTVSNHHSCFDDPGLWGILPIRILYNAFNIRWAMAAHDICFTNKWHSLLFLYGKCIPVVRGNGVYQEAINICIQKCALGDWVHVFPEGKVNMTKEEMRLKWGVGRIIYESPKIPIILPLWHEGMDTVLPNVEPYVLKWGKKVTVNIGNPLDLNDFIEDLKNRDVPEPTARKLITDKIQAAFRHLRLETEELHNARN